MTKNYKMDIRNKKFAEIINISKLQYILTNQKHFDDIFTTERDKLKIKSDQKYKYNIFNLINKILSNCIKIDNSDYGYLLVSYKKGNGTEYGRWYASKGIGLQNILNSVRHTICDDKWIDIDQVNSHPSILQQLFTKHKLQSDKLDYLISNREDFLKSIMDELGISRGEAKTIIIAVINGGSTYKSKIAKDFKDEVFKNIEKICKLTEYNAIFKETKEKIEKDNSTNIYGKCISKILQVIENDMLEHYIQFFVDKNYIPTIYLNGNEYLQTALIFDGLEIPYNVDINDDILKECKEYTFKHTGYNINLITKPFDNALELPSNYAECIEDIPLIINNLKIGIEYFKNKNRDIIDEAIEYPTHYNCAVVFAKMLKGKIYCENEKSWFYCNSNNIWKESSTPMILEAIIPDIGNSLFNLIFKEYISKSMDASLDENDRKNFLEKSHRVRKLINGFGTTPFRNNIIKGHYYLYHKENFKEDFLDSKTHLFAFSDKLFDFSLKPDKPKDRDLTINDFIRYIKPDDYISTNTGYQFPSECDEEYTTTLDNYFNDLFPIIDSIDDNGNDIKLNEGKKQYVLDIFSTALNGANNEQSVYFHTGRGSNSKTTLLSLIEKVFGKYFQSLNAETFTEKMRANACNDLYKLFGKRFTTFQEPDDTNGTQLQTSTLKIFGDNDSVKLNGNQKYKNPIQFLNQSSLHGAMNKKPSLSGVDGGIKRRVKIIEYTTQFLDKDKIFNSDFHKPKDPDFMKKVKSPDMRDAFIVMLLNNWIKNVKDVGEIKVPQCVVDASKEYCDDCDMVLKFVNDKCKITMNDKDRIKSSELYCKYKCYVKSNTSDTPLSDKKFKESMLDINGITCKRSNGVNYCGLIFMENRDEDPKPVIGPDKDEDIQFRPDTPPVEENTIVPNDDDGYDSPEPCKDTRHLYGGKKKN